MPTKVACEPSPSPSPWSGRGDSVPLPWSGRRNSMTRYGRRPGPAPRICQKPSTPTPRLAAASTTALMDFTAPLGTAVALIQPTQKALPQLIKHCKRINSKKATIIKLHLTLAQTWCPPPLAPTLSLIREREKKWLSPMKETGEKNPHLTGAAASERHCLATRSRFH